MRSELGLRGARRRLDRLAAALDLLRDEAGTGSDPEAVRRWGEARNRLLVGRLVVSAALARRESRGAHCRTDHPDAAPAAERSIHTLTDLFTLGAGAAGPLPGDAACRIL
ncbi:hypothetical protein [Azospirillum thermophilum]|uniref:hypothetical protein n=1 Tax=Azospirillum thermophilum TaxID=2202148 RepID=UPI001FE7ACAC|nr:hypothetical protein [Azospirillum thermophilum]